MKTKIKPLQALATDMVGDGKNPNLFFVTEQGITVTVTRDFEMAYRQWETLAHTYPQIESALEDRKWGVITSVEPREQGVGRLIRIDDSRQFRKFHKTTFK